MKRLWILLLVLVLLPLSALGEKNDRKEKLVRQYQAWVIHDTAMRRTPEDRFCFATLKEDEKVVVYELGDPWSLINRSGDVGYVKTQYLGRFHSLDPFTCPVPDRTVNAGVVMLADTHKISGGKFSGLNAAAGTAVCVLGQDDAQYQLAVWRGRGTLPLDAGEYRPFVSWEDAQPGDLIGGFTTYYNSKTGAPRAKERAYNIELGCKRISGKVIQAGASFSFNKTCAPYSQKNGYQYGPNISKTGFGYGGGVCQVSTTLYNAVLGLPLLVNEVGIHQKSGVKYIPQWFDSAVGSYSDLKFTNLLPCAIRIWADAQGGAVTVLIYRAEETE